MTELCERVALIVGAGRGFGSATAARFAEAGADRALNYRRSQEGCTRVVEQARQMGNRAISVRANISDARDVTAIKIVNLSSQLALIGWDSGWSTLGPRVSP